VLRRSVAEADSPSGVAKRLHAVNEKFLGGDRFDPELLQPAAHVAAHGRGKFVEGISSVGANVEPSVGVALFIRLQEIACDRYLSFPE
jgi:hypothetical protein